MATGEAVITGWRELLCIKQGTEAEVAEETLYVMDQTSRPESEEGKDNYYFVGRDHDNCLNHMV